MKIDLQSNTLVMFAINQEAINGQSLLYPVVIGSTEEQAQHSHSKKDNSLNGFYIQTNIAFFFWSITAQIISNWPNMFQPAHL